MLVIRDFGMLNSTYPVVFETPETEKLSSIFEESKERLDRVEFEEIEKTLSISKGVTAKLTTVSVSK
jgi:hypothetical protein